MTETAAVYRTKRPLTVTLPWPAQELFPNRRKQSRYNNDVYQASKMAACNRVGVAVADWFLPEQPCLVAFFHPPSNRYDLDNSWAACKAYIDGLAQALGINDRIFRRAVQVWGEKLPEPCVILQVRSAEGLSEWLELP